MYIDYTVARPLPTHTIFSFGGDRNWLIRIRPTVDPVGNEAEIGEEISRKHPQGGDHVR